MLRYDCRGSLLRGRLIPEISRQVNLHVDAKRPWRQTLRQMSVVGPREPQPLDLAWATCQQTLPAAVIESVYTSVLPAESQQAEGRLVPVFSPDTCLYQEAEGKRKSMDSHPVVLCVHCRFILVCCASCYPAVIPQNTTLLLSDPALHPLSGQ